MIGDVMLVELVRVTRPLLRASDVVARLGDDECMVFMAEVNDEKMMVKKSWTLIACFAEAVYSRALSDGVGLSIGVVVERDILSSSAFVPSRRCGTLAGKSCR